MTDEYNSNILPGAPELGPPACYFHGVWVGAPEDEAVEWYDELDALRWSIRCVRKFRDGSLKAYSYACTGATKCQINLFLSSKRSTRMPTLSAKRSRRQSLRTFGSEQEEGRAEAGVRSTSAADLKFLRYLQQTLLRTSN